MIDRLKALFTKDSVSAEPKEDKVQLAAAVLMVEAALMDGEFTIDERETISSILQRHLDISSAETSDLIAMAEAQQEDANHLFRYTHAVKEQLDEPERLELIELLWEVVYADGESHAYEANLLRRVAGLIYVSDKDRGEARKRVLRRLGVKE